MLWILNRPDLSNEEVANGWRVSYHGAYKVKMAQWMKMTRIAGTTFLLLYFFFFWSLSLSLSLPPL
jgi:hypothetical protein